MAELADPRFRYEEEAMYPQLTSFFGDAYEGRLLPDHDGAIRNACELAWLAGNDPLTADQAGRGAEPTPYTEDPWCFCRLRTFQCPEDLAASGVRLAA